VSDAERLARQIAEAARNWNRNGVLILVPTNACQPDTTCVTLYERIPPTDPTRLGEFDGWYYAGGGVQGTISLTPYALGLDHGPACMRALLDQRYRYAGQVNRNLVAIGEQEGPRPFDPGEASR